MGEGRPAEAGRAGGRFRTLLLDIASHVLCRLGKGRRARPPAGTAKVNLGSGLAVAPGWTNVDASLHAFVAGWPRPLLRLAWRLSGSRGSIPEEAYVAVLRGHAFVHHDVRHGIPFPDASVDWLYSSHLLEHLHAEEGRRLLEESFRILKEGGGIRVCVPDLEHAVALYTRGEREAALRFFFAEPEAGSLRRHHSMYDYEMLRTLLEAAGFTGVTRCAFRQGRAPDLDVLDNRPEETLYVEALKPEGRAGKR